MYSPDGKVIVEGEWEAEQIVSGTAYPPDSQGKYYKGSFQEMAFHGKGTYYNQDGSIFQDGEFAKGVLLNGTQYGEDDTSTEIVDGKPKSN